MRKSYDGTEVLKGIDLEVGAGQIFGFLGPNGAGKTTTIEILEGYRSRDAGEVSVLGVDPSRPTRAWRARVGLVLQECELDPLLTVKETLRLFASFYERSRDLDEVIELVGLGDRVGARLGNLSGGQRRRADVAVALIGDPDLIFLDEPTTGFDPAARREAWETISELKRLGKTVLLTTHYMDEAQHLSDRVAVIRDGEIVAEGSPDSLRGELRGRAVVSFRLPAGASLEDVRTHTEVTPQASGADVELHVDDAQHVLYRLTAWAEREQLRLEGLEVHQPTLEDVFLELTGSSGTDAEAPADAGPTLEDGGVGA